MCWSPADMDLNPDWVISSCAIVGGGGEQSWVAREHEFPHCRLGRTPSFLEMVVRVRDRVGTVPRPEPRMCSEHSNSHCPPHSLSQLSALCWGRARLNTAVGHMGNYS